MSTNSAPRPDGAPCINQANRDSGDGAIARRGRGQGRGEHRAVRGLRLERRHDGQHWRPAQPRRPPQGIRILIIIININ